MSGPIVSAACMQGDKIWAGKNHSEIINIMVSEGASVPIKQSQQGFVDSDGIFLDRESAYKRAVECGQIKDDGGLKKLFSEDLKGT